MTTLWRATADGYTGQWSCWSRDRSVALAYTDNPGYGGASLVRVEADPEHVLDLRKGADMLTLAEAIADEPEAHGATVHDILDGWRARGYGWSYEVWEGDESIRALLPQLYDWIVYLDTYPDGAETWCYLGSGTL